MVYTIFVRDSFQPFAMGDCDIIAKLVVSCDVSVCGKYLKFDVSTLGTCEREVVDTLATSHRHLSKLSRFDDGEVEWLGDQDDEIVGMVSVYDFAVRDDDGGVREEE